MPQMPLTGVVLGLRSKPYDFEQGGRRVQGISHRLFLWDLDQTEPIEVTVPADILGVVGTLGEGQLVTLGVEPRANNNKIAYQFAGIGEVHGQYFKVTGEAAKAA